MAGTRPVLGSVRDGEKDNTERDKEKGNRERERNRYEKQLKGKRSGAREIMNLLCLVSRLFSIFIY